MNVEDVRGFLAVVDHGRVVLRPMNWGSPNPR